MKVVEFHLIKTTKEYHFARVIVESWFGLKSEARDVYRERFSSFWKWLDDGKFVDGSEIDRLEESRKAQAAMKENTQ